jgi:twinkle protein
VRLEQPEAIVQIEHQVRGEAHRLGYGQHKIVCPACGPERRKKGERSLSLQIDRDRALFRCWHCGQEGIVPLKDTITIPRERKVSVAQKINWNNLSSQALKWLEDRKISEATAKKLGIKSTSAYVQAIGRETECVVFPYLNNGTEYAAKIRSVEGKGFKCNGAPQSFFNLNNVQPNDWLIIVEGEMDVAALVEAGYDSAVSVPNGAPIKVVDGAVDPESDTKFRYVWDAKKQIDLAERIVIATDSDGPGQAAAEEIARRIGKDRCWTVTFPEGCKDANDVLMKHGKDGVDRLISECKPWPISGLYDSSHFFSQLDEIYDRGIGRGESTGYPGVDDIYTIAPGQLTIVTGHPSSGKSEFVDQVMMNLAEEKGWTHAICSFENEPRLHIAKLISKRMRKPFFEGRSQRMTRQELEDGKRFVQSHFSFLYQADGSLATLDSILERLRAAVMRHGIRGAVIDPYNYIAKSTDVSETDWISTMLSQVRLFAQAHDIHIWFVAHPTKMMRSADGRIPVPNGNDISGSAAWWAKADCGISVHRPDPVKSPVSEIHCWKCRFSWIGKQGKAVLIYNPASSTYGESGPDPFADMAIGAGVPQPTDEDDSEVPF